MTGPRVTTKIKVRLPNRTKLLAKGIDIPGYVWQQPPFVFDPDVFIPSHQDLQKKIIEADTQLRSHSAWMNGDFRNGVYACASDPNDSKALYFAAHLVDLWQQRVSPNQRVIWHTIKSTGYKNELIDNNEPCDLLVLSNLTPNSSPSKMERTRDLLVHYSGIPRILVIAGEDPVSFFARRLYFKLNGVFFASDKLIRRKIEVL